MSENKRLPKSDFGKCVGDPVVAYLINLDSLDPLDLPHEDGRLQGRLVGVDRPGVWLEPKAWFDESMKAEEPVRHVFLKWENLAGLTRTVESELFMEKIEYRGLRPRH